MILFTPNNNLEEEIFTPRNLDPDCDTIGRLLDSFGEKFILSALEDGEYSIAVDYYLQMLIRFVGTLSRRSTGAGSTTSIPRTTPCHIFGKRSFPIFVPAH